MAALLTARKLTDRVRKRVSDAGSLVWDDSVILETADDALQSIFDTVRMSGALHDLDRKDIAVSAFTTVETQWSEYALPEYIGSIRKVEGLPSTSAGSSSLWQTFEIWDAPFDNHDAPRSPLYGSIPLWTRSRWGRPGSFSIWGDISRFASIRVWFTRKWPPLHFGTAAGGSTTTLVFSSSPQGVVVARDDLYVGMQIEVSADSGGTPVPVDSLRRITGYVGSTKTATLESAWPSSGASTSTTQYSMVVPLEAEHTEYLMEQVTLRLLQRAGNELHIGLMTPRMMQLEERFVASLSQRDAKPLRIWNRR